MKTGVRKEGWKEKKINQRGELFHASLKFCNVGSAKEHMAEIDEQLPAFVQKYLINYLRPGLTMQPRLDCNLYCG